MARITQSYPLTTAALIDSANLQFDLNQLFATINSLNKNNLAITAGAFDFGGTKLSGLTDPTSPWNDTNDLQVAVTKAFLKSVLLAEFPAASGNWHIHANKTILDAIVSAGDGSIPSAAERARFNTQNEKDGLDNSPTPITAANPVASQADLTGVAGANGATWFTDSYNASIGIGATHNTTTLSVTGSGLFKARVEAAFVQGASNHNGAVDFEMIHNAAGELWLGIIQNVGRRNAGGVITTGYPFPGLDMSSAAEASRNVWNLLGSGLMIPRLYGPLPDATPVLIGLAGDNTNYSGIYITRSGTNVYFSAINGLGVAAAAKISLFGYKR